MDTEKLAAWHLLWKSGEGILDWAGRFDDIVSTVTSDSLRVRDSEIFTSLSKLEPGGHLRKAHPKLGAAGGDGYVVG